MIEMDIWGWGGGGGGDLLKGIKSQTYSTKLDFFKF